LWSVVVALVMFCAMGQLMAETYTPHGRRVTSRYTTAHFVGHRGSAARGGRAKISEGSGRRARARKSAPVTSRRVSARERRSVRSAAPVMHRVNGRRRRGERGRRGNAPEVVARMSSKEAQGAAASAVYASGVADPNESLNAVSGETGSGREAAGAMVTSTLEASAAQRVPAPLVRSGPSDLVGAPLTASPRVKTTTHADVDGVSHEELAEAVAQPVVLPGIYRYGRLVVPPPMRGTREILMHQNLIADEEGLSRIQDDDDLRRMRAERMLVDFPESASLHVNGELAGDRRCARPWAVRFAADMARAYYSQFHVPLQVNSAVRTVAYQIRLRRVNGNAAGIGGDMASPHLTGEALDFGKRDMSKAEIAWMRTYLKPLMQAGKVDVEEEFQQACFHISVYRLYAPDLPSSRREYAQLGGAHVSRSHVD
jgi:hypothetical protein